MHTGAFSRTAGRVAVAALVAVLALGAGMHGASAETAGAAAKPSVPSAPASFKAAAGAARVVLTWDGGDGETRYELRGASLRSGVVAFDVSLPAGTVRFSDPIDAAKRGGMTYVLTACNAAGCSTAATVVVRP